MSKIIAFVFICIAVNKTSGQVTYPNTLRTDSSYAVNSPELSRLNWIAGSWTGKAFGANTEEVWNEASGGSLMGMFKLFDDDKVIFYELMSIANENDQLILRIRHFNVDMTAWEEKEESVVFPFVQEEENRFYFDGLTFEKVSENEMNVYVLIDHNDGSITEEKFAYKRK